MLVMLSQLSARGDIDTLLADLPDDWRPRFTAWMIATRDNPALLGDLPLKSLIVERMTAWLANRSPIGDAPPSHLTAEDRAVLEQMLANRAKRMQQSAQDRGKKPLPADSPMMKRWESEEFLVGSSDDGADDITFHAKQLAAADPESRVYSLKALAGTPIADDRLLRACEQLLDDRTITLLGIPYSYGEVRWVAADAVAAMRGAIGRKEPVVIDDVFAPVDGTRVGQLAEQAGIESSRTGGTRGAIETLERIAAAGKLPRRRIVRDPA
jgi:hypothetical protein